MLLWAVVGSRTTTCSTWTTLGTRAATTICSKVHCHISKGLLISAALGHGAPPPPAAACGALAAMTETARSQAAAATEALEMEVLLNGFSMPVSTSQAIELFTHAFEECQLL